MVFDRKQWRTSQSDTTGRVHLPHNGYREGVDSGVHVGTIIVRDRLPWRVLEIKEKPEDLWPAYLEEAWEKVMTKWFESEAARAAGEPTSWGAPREPAVMPFRSGWIYRPVNIVVQHPERPKSKPEHWCALVSYDWQIIPEHYSVCRLCKELPPCRHSETEAEVAQAVSDADRLMAIPHGACLGCGRAISSRMKSIRFPGPNLWRPDWGNDTAVFHLRDQLRDYECTNGTFRYKQQWEAAGLNVLVPQAPEEPR